MTSSAVSGYVLIRRSYVNTVLVLTTGRASYLGLSSSAFDLLAVSTRVLLSLVRASDFLFRYGRSSFLGRSIGNKVGLVPFCHITFLISLLFLRGVRRLTGKLFVSVLRVVIGYNGLAGLRLLCRRVCAKGYLDVRSGLARSIFPIAVQGCQVRSSVLLYRLFSLFRVFNVGLRCLWVTALWRRLSREYLAGELLVVGRPFWRVCYLLRNDGTTTSCLRNGLGTVVDCASSLRHFLGLFYRCHASAFSLAIILDISISMMQVSSTSASVPWTIGVSTE